MWIDNRHERFIDAPPERLAELVADFDRVWPTELAPVPTLDGQGLYEAGRMRWQEVDRRGATRAFRVVAPEGLRLEHWFELEPRGTGTIVRHVVSGRATEELEDVWRRRIEPRHDLIVEGILDRAEATATRPR